MRISYLLTTLSILGATFAGSALADGFGSVQIFGNGASSTTQVTNGCQGCQDKEGKVNQQGFFYLAMRQDISHFVVPATDRDLWRKNGGKKIYYLWGNMEREHVALALSAARATIWEFQDEGFDVVVDCATTLDEAKTYFADPLMYGFFWGSHGNKTFTDRGFLTTNEGDKCKCVDGSCGHASIKYDLGDGVKKKGTGLCYSELRTKYLETRLPQFPVAFGLICSCGAESFVHSSNPKEPSLHAKLLSKPGCVRAVKNSDFQGGIDSPQGYVEGRYCDSAPGPLFWKQYQWAQDNKCGSDVSSDPSQGGGSAGGFGSQQGPSQGQPKKQTPAKPAPKQEAESEEEPETSPQKGSADKGDDEGVSEAPSKGRPSTGVRPIRSPAPQDNSSQPTTVIGPGGRAQVPQPRPSENSSGIVRGVKKQPKR